MGTGTCTKTVVDVRKVLNNFRADFSMISQSTGLWERAAVDSDAEDLIRFADSGYLVSIILKLIDSNGVEVCGRQYNVSNSALGWRSDDTGDNLWPRTPGGKLVLIAIVSDAWSRLGELGRMAERKKLGITGSWPQTDESTSFTGMAAVRDRQYASNG